QLRGLSEEAASRWYRAGAGPVRFQPFGQAGQVDLRVEVVHDLRGGGLEQPDGRRGLPVPGRLAQDRGPPGTEVGAQVVPALRGRYERLGGRRGRCGRCGRRGSGWCGHAGPAPYTFLFPMNLSPKTWSPWMWVDATTGGSGSGPFGGGAVWAGGRPGGAG